MVSNPILCSVCNNKQQNTRYTQFDQTSHFLIICQVRTQINSEQCTLFLSKSFYQTQKSRFVVFVPLSGVSLKSSSVVAVRYYNMCYSDVLHKILETFNVTIIAIEWDLGPLLLLPNYLPRLYSFHPGLCQSSQTRTRSLTQRLDIQEQSSRGSRLNHDTTGSQRQATGFFFFIHYFYYYYLLSIIARQTYG